MGRSVVCIVLIAALVACGDEVGPREEPSGAGRVAFQMRRNDAWDVYTAAADGSDRRNLTQSREDDHSPVWSRDSRRIAFISARSPQGIYVVNADGSGRRLMLAGDFLYDPAWSPDGNRVVFGSTAGGGPEIYIINADGTGLHRLITSASSPDWSPSGAQILFHRNGNIMLIDVDGTDLTNLTPNTSTTELDPVWSPDGSRIGFVSTLGGSLSVYTMANDGSDWRRVTTPPAGSADRVPDWSPDGTEMAFQRETFPTGQVYGVRVDGTGLRILADTLSGHPTW